MQKLFLIAESKNVYKYGVAAILLVIPLYPKFPIFNVPGTYVAVRAEDFLISILSFFWLIYILKIKAKNFLFDKLNLAIMLFFIAGALSLISAMFLTGTVDSNIAILHWARRIEYVMPFFMAYTAIKRGSRINFFVQTLLVTALVSFLVGWAQKHLGFPIISTQNEEYSKGMALRWIPGARLPSTFAGHYDLAAFFVLFLPIIVGYLFTIRKFVSRAGIFLLFIIPSYWLFLQSESRVSFIAFLAGAVVTLFLLKKKIYIIPLFALCILGMFFLSDLGSRYTRTFNIYKEKYLDSGPKFMNLQSKFRGYNIFSPKHVLAVEDSKLIAFKQLEFQQPTVGVEDRSTSIRLNVEWPRAIRAFFKNSLLGTGYSSITLATDNDYLRLLGEVGLIGFLSFLLIILRMMEKFGNYLRNFEKIDINNAYVAGFIGSMAGFLINALFIDVFEASKVAIIFWTIAGIAVGTASKKRIVKQQKVE